MVKAITVDAMEVDDAPGVAAIAATANQPVDPLMAFIGVTADASANNAEQK